ncbi:ABC transporter ATP-binding protein, partial [Staphylococcus pseudintermedius]
GRTWDVPRVRGEPVGCEMPGRDVTSACALVAKEHAGGGNEHSARPGYLRVQIEAYEDISQVIQLPTEHRLDVYPVTEVQHAIKELSFKKMDGMPRDEDEP